MQAATLSLARRSNLLGPAALVAVAAIVVYWPALTGGFVWDDDALLTQNALVKARDGLYRIWFTTEALDYWPVTNTSFWIEWRLWGMHAAGYHATNLALHIGSGLLVWALLRRLSVPGAYLGAFLFVLHPVNVESVAWIAQRKNTLSMLFFLASILWYLKNEFDPPAGQVAGVALPARRRQRAPARRAGHGPSASRAPTRSRSLSRWYWLSLLAFVLAMLSKGSVAILPGVLILLVSWVRGTVTRRDLVRAAPFVAVAIALTLVNIWFQSHMAAGPIRQATLVQRALGAGAVVWFYLSKAVWPVGLMFVYPQWEIRAGDVLWWVPTIAAGAVTLLLFWQRCRPPVRAVLYAWIFFCLALAPVLGIIDVYFMRFSLVADHYQYIAILGVVAVVAAGVFHAASPARPAESADGARPAATGYAVGRALGLNRAAGRTAWCAAVLLPLAIATWWQSRDYASAETLYRRTLSRNPRAWMAHNNLALSQLNGSAQDLQEALGHLRAALASNPEQPSIHNNLGTTLYMLDDVDGALKHHREAIRLSPRYADAHRNLGADYQKAGRYQEAVDAYGKALHLDPGMESVRANVAVALTALGRHDEAHVQLEQALRKKPVTVTEHGAAGDALLALGQTDAAIAQYKDALRRDPGSAGTLNNLGYALRVAGRYSEAESVLRQALRLRPDDAAVHDNLGNVLQQVGRLDESIAEFTLALRAGSPLNLAEINNDMGVALAKRGRADESVAYFREALRIKPDLATAQANLARALGR